MALMLTHRSRAYCITMTDTTITINEVTYLYALIAHYPETNTLFIRIDHTPYRITYVDDNDTYTITSINTRRTHEVIAPYIHHETSRSFTPATHVRSPLSGRIIKTYVKAQQFVHKHDPLIVIESMKMENEIRAEHDAFIKTISITEGDVVQTDQVLIEFEENNNGGNNE